ncbi:MAG: histidinol-phosphatase HisJ family protein [Planctomycetes bacterium]|nr:histidinol-phosphatase HisJ family protein [Planctomycetota bacterium]
MTNAAATRKRLLYETHSHTPLCRHAVGEPGDYAEFALRRGLRGVIVTCHNPMPDGFSSSVRMALDEFDAYVAMVERARAEWAGRVDIRLGIEADFFEGYEAFVERQLDAAPFEYVIGSVHPQIGEYRKRYWDDDPVRYQTAYFTRLADAAEAGLFDCLSHPDIIKNETAGAWEPDRIMDAIGAALDRIARTGIAMELNTSGANKTIPEMNPFPAMLRAMRSRGVPVVVGSDAHVPERTGDRFETALELLRSCGYESVSHFVGRRRVDVPIENALASLVPADQGFNLRIRNVVTEP